MSNESDNSVVSVTITTDFPVQTPTKVYDSQGKVLGFAVVGIVGSKVSIKMDLDKNRPETFDLMNDPRRVKVRFGVFGNEKEVCFTLSLES